jgi:ABC-type glycerol-3-phosphate transport system substrate-binding protein
VNQIDRSIPVPIYYQLKTFIKKQIDEGVLKPGDKVQTEEEICELFSISRTPVRQALLELVREGILTRTAGRGTFVTFPEQRELTLRVVVPDERWSWLIRDAANLWNEKNRGAKIGVEFSTVPLVDLHDHLSLMVGQGEAPDISIIDSVWIAEFAHRRYLYSLSELDPDWAVEVQDRFYASILSANSYNGEQYALPTNADATVLWYRRDWFSAEGLEPPRTWDELLSICKYFRQPEIRARYGLGAHPLAFVGGRVGGETTTYQLLPFIWSAGGAMIEDNIVTLDSTATRQALEFIRDLVNQEQLVSTEVVRSPWNGAAMAFAQGKVALAVGGTYENFIIQSITGWDLQTYLQRVGFVPIPAGPQGSQATLVGGMTYGIYRQSRFAKEALDLLKLTLDTQILKPFSLRTGQNAAYIPVAQAIQPEEDGFLGRTDSLFAQGKSRPSLPAYDQVSRQFQEMVEACLSGQLSIDGAVSRTAERISGITGFPVNKSLLLTS